MTSVPELRLHWAELLMPLALATEQYCVALCALQEDASAAALAPALPDLAALMQVGVGLFTAAHGSGIAWLNLQRNSGAE